MHSGERGTSLGKEVPEWNMELKWGISSRQNPVQNSTGTTGSSWDILGSAGLFVLS